MGADLPMEQSMGPVDLPCTWAGKWVWPLVLAIDVDAGGKRMSSSLKNSYKEVITRFACLRWVHVLTSSSKSTSSFSSKVNIDRDFPELLATVVGTWQWK